MLSFEREAAERRKRIAAARAEAATVKREEAKSHSLVQYLHDPVGWVAGCMPGAELAPYQSTGLRELVANKRHAVRGPHGLGKTFISAVTVLWFSTTSEASGKSWKIGTTASAWRQLTKFLWPEIRALSKQMDWAALGMSPWVRHEHLLDLSIKLEQGEAFAAASDVPENLEGLHADRVLYVYDESKTIKRATWEATEGAFSGAGDDTAGEAYALAVSTPGAPAGVFYDIHQRKPGTEDWSSQHVTVQEAIDAGRISAAWVEQRKRQWGPRSAVFLNRVLGEFAADDEKSMIPLSWVEAAVARWHAWNDALDDQLPPPVASRLGVDVARHGSDKTVIAHILGNVVTHLDVEDYTDNVVDLADRVSQAAPGAHCVVDADGMGVGTADRLRTVTSNALVTVFHGGPRPEWWADRSGELEAFNTRAAAWWSFRERLDPAFNPTVCLPPIDELIGDLCAPERIYNAAEDRIKLEKKADTKKRLGRSPDYADAVVMGFWFEHVPAPAEEWIPDDEFTNSIPASEWSRRPEGMSTGHGGNLTIGINPRT